MRTAENGDVIKVGHVIYSHYGIYVREGWKESVIHYTDENSAGDFKGKISETSVKHFLNGAKREDISVVSITGHVYSAEETVRRARSKLGKEGYNLVTNNCEHFAVWCKTGHQRSSQVKRGKSSLLMTCVGIFFMAICGRKVI